MKEILLTLVCGYNYFILAYFLALNGGYALLNIISFFSIRRYLKERETLQLKRIFRSTFYKPISVIIPAHNEERTIVESVNSLLHLQYPRYEVVVVNDGSNDHTLRVLVNQYNLLRVPLSYPQRLKSRRVKSVYASRDYPNLMVIDKERGGKGDALNAGINVARFPLICCIDADSLLESDALLKVARPFLENPDTIATGGVIRVANGCEIRAGKIIKVGMPKSSLARFQIVEYIRAFLFGRTGWDALQDILIISGAFGLFSKLAVVECGGYRTDTVGEDMELVVRMHRVMRKNKKKYNLKFVPEPVCWTEVPERIKVLAGQRNRWQRGLMDSLLENARMLFNPAYGVVGMLGMPFFFLFEMLGPVIEFTGYVVFLTSWSLNIVDSTFALLFFSVAILLGIVLSVGSLVLEELSFRRYPKISYVLILFLYAILENFGYRQLHTWWRFKGCIDYILKRKGWGGMQRKGFGPT